MDKPTPPNGTYEDWLRYYAEHVLWEYLRRYQPLLSKEVHADGRTALDA